MTIEIITFGCRLNTYESEVMKNHALAAELSDTLVFNTCAVTAQAEAQARQAIRRARREHPHKRIIVTGCAAQIDPAKFASMDEVDAVLGNSEKMDAGEWAQVATLGAAPSPLAGEGWGEGATDSAASDLAPPHPILLPQGEKAYPTEAPSAFAKSDWRLTTEKIRVNDIMSVRETASHLVTSFEGRARAFLQVQNGCNHRCTFCIIPFGRGNSRSVPIGEIVMQTRALVAAGYHEVVLTGVDVSDYGLDLPGTPSLGAMMRRVLALVPELKRLRLSSIDAVEVDDELFRLIAEEPRLMPHLHLSIQAGDDMILKRMKRRHSRADIVDFCARVRSVRPDMMFGADLIAGFPTETEAMFEHSRTLIGEVGLSYLHVFPYSARSGTPAAKMPQLRMEVRKARAKILRQEGEKQLATQLQNQVGREMNIIVEQGGTQGHAENFATVKLPVPLPVGTLQRVRIARADESALYAA